LEAAPRSGVFAGPDVLKVSPSFSEEKEAKRLLYAGAWALAQPQPMPQINKSFLVLFFKKEPLPPAAFEFFRRPVVTR
jgi:hypothetical protein